MRRSLHFETVPVTVVRNIAKPLPRSGIPLVAPRRLSVVVKARVQRPLIPRKGN